MRAERCEPGVNAAAREQMTHILKYEGRPHRSDTPLSSGTWLMCLFLGKMIICLCDDWWMSSLSILEPVKDILGERVILIKNLNTQF